MFPPEQKMLKSSLIIVWEHAQLEEKDMADKEKTVKEEVKVPLPISKEEILKKLAEKEKEEQDS